MADILDTAQTNQPQNPTSDPVIPPVKPAPESPVTPASDSLIVPPPEDVKPTELPKEEALPASPPPNENKPKKRMKPAVLITVLLVMIITLPLTVIAVKNTLNLFGYACNTEDFACRHQDATSVNLDSPENVKREKDNENAPPKQDVTTSYTDRTVTVKTDGSTVTTYTSGDKAGQIITSSSDGKSTTTTLAAGHTCDLSGNDEGRVACAKNPPQSLTITTKPDGTTTTTVVAHTINASGILNPDESFTLSTTTAADGSIVLQTLNGLDITNSSKCAGKSTGIVGCLGLFSPASTVCVQNGDGTWDYTCADLTNLKTCTAPTQAGIGGSGGNCNLVCGAGSWAVTSTGTAFCFDAAPVISTTPINLTSCQACAAAGNSASECSAVCGVQRPTAPATVKNKADCLASGGVWTSEPGTECGGPGGYRNECVLGGHWYFVNCDTTNRQPPEGTGTPTPQCINLVAYDKNGNALSPTELAALHVGDTIRLAFAPGGPATKVRFAVNPSSPPVASDWHESTTHSTTNPGQFIWDYQLANTTSFNIVAQWFDGTAWH